MAKLHVRHMVGGRTARVENEFPCRFEFPQLPGALPEFLDKLGDRWNISLFHYRNHGADFGRVLAAFEVPDTEQEDFKRFLDTVGYPYRLESDNAAYGLFLA
jgi:threonine dehydratase